MNFSTLQGLKIPEGVVTQIAKDGIVLWKLQSEEPNKPIILEVEKIISNTYAGSTTYNNEEFILLDIYPKTNGTVNITYGGLTKTIKDTSGVEEPNAQQVFFGTFNGVTDEVTTPASGTLTIEGECVAFGCGAYKTGSKSSNIEYYNSITSINEWGNITSIPERAFYNCTSLTITTLPIGITSIGVYAFFHCTGITISEIPEGVTEIQNHAFSVGDEHNMPDTIILPSSIVYLGTSAFANSAGGMSLTITNKIIIRATEPPTLEDDTVFGTDINNIVVPVGCGEAYKTAENWSAYAGIISEVK